MILWDDPEKDGPIHYLNETGWEKRVTKEYKKEKL